MTHSPEIRLTDSELTVGVLSGARIHGADYVTVGSIGGVQGSGDDARIVVEVGGFLGFGAKPVALKVREFDFLRDTRGKLHVRTAWSKKALQRLPEYRAPYRPVGHSAI